MDDGRPAPPPASQVIEATPTMARIIVIVGCVLAVIAAFVGILLWNSGGSGLSYLAPKALGIVLFLPLLGVLATVITSRSVTLTERLTGWANPTIEFTPWPPTLGRTMTAVYRRDPISTRARSRLPVQLLVEAELVCEEWVEYTVGTDTRTDTHDVFRERLSGHSTPGGARVEAVLTIRIPSESGAPTIHLDHNKVRWRLETRLGQPFGKRTATRIDLPVAAELDLDFLVGEGREMDGRRPEAGP